MPEIPALEWTADELLDRLLARERFFLLDVRSRHDFESWRIEGREPLPTYNEPYFELIERAESDDPNECAAALVSTADAPALPRDQEVLVACAKGGSSAFVAEGLRQLGYRAANLAGGMDAWAGTTYARPIVRDPALTIFQIVRPARGCLSYVVASRGVAVIVDPFRNRAPYVALLKSEHLGAKHVLDTHAHADHLSGGPALARTLGVPYALHPYDSIHPMDMMPAVIPYEPLRDRQTIPVGAVTIEVLHIAGHTLGNVALRVGGYLLAGDSIFIDSIARPDLGGRGEAWAALHWHSLRRLLALGDDVQVLPGHFSRLAESDDTGTFVAALGTLRRTNEGLIAAQKNEREFVDYILSHLPEFPPQYVDIKRVNLGLKHADEDAATELEVGKNICAMAHAN